jgi:pyruvate-ferredoxin/flavodoxin oxidoreductase
MTRTIMDGNTAAAYIAFRVNEVNAIFPITPSSTMAELADQWASEGQTNIWGNIPVVQEMQSEGGAAGTVHGALQSGALTTTYTASQGLMLMLPNMFKIAGELTCCVFHVASRSLATSALSIFGDHSDVMTVRGTGFALLCAASVQEAHDMALIAQVATLESRIPFLHFFDGFRTSHELNTLELISDPDIRAMIDDDLVRAHRKRGLSPEAPFIRGTAQNPDIFFQAREAVNSYYEKVPGIVEAAMTRLAALTGRQYHLFDYAGDPAAERAIVIMGSAAETAQQTAAALCGKGEKVGVLQVRLFRPFSATHLLAALPATVRQIAVLDRVKEPGAGGEPLFQDVVTALACAVARGERAAMPYVIGGRYGLGSKDFTPAMAKAIFDELRAATPRQNFTVGIDDDLTHTSLTIDATYSVEPDSVTRAVFYGLGADGTVGANKNSVKIIAEDAGLFAQGYFVYDSHKSGARTVSHLRFGKDPIRSPYLIARAGFVGIHQFVFLERQNLLLSAGPGATVLLNVPGPADGVWNKLSRPVQQTIIERKLRVFAIDASKVARDAGLGGRTNTVLQTCFFALSGVLPRDEAIGHIKDAIARSYAQKGQAVVDKNNSAVDAALAHLHQVQVPAAVSSHFDIAAQVPASAPEFVRTVTARIFAGAGDELPTSLVPADGTFPSGTAMFEKRNVSDIVPDWR